MIFMDGLFVMIQMMEKIIVGNGIVASMVRTIVLLFVLVPNIFSHACTGPIETSAIIMFSKLWRVVI